MPYRYQRLELHHLRYFVAVAQTGGFRRAAELLHVAQPAISRAVQQLEQDLRRPLLVRSRDGARLTPDGTAVLARAVSIMDACDQLGNGLEPVDWPAIRIGHVMPAYLRAGPLAAVLQDFRTAHPGVRVDVVPMLHGRMTAALVSGHLDIGFGWLPIDDVPEPLRIDVVYIEEPVVALPATHPLAGAREVRLADLGDDLLLSFPRASMPERYDEIVGMLRRGGAGNQIRALAPDLRAVLAAVGSGEGIAIVPRSAATLVDDVGVRLLPMAGVRARWNLAMLSPDRSRSTLAADVISAFRLAAVRSTTRSATAPRRGSRDARKSAAARG